MLNIHNSRYSLVLLAQGSSESKNLSSAVPYSIGAASFHITRLRSDTIFISIQRGVSEQLLLWEVGSEGNNCCMHGMPI